MWALDDEAACRSAWVADLSGHAERLPAAGCIGLTLTVAAVLWLHAPAFGIDWVPTDAEMARYRESWNPRRTGPRIPPRRT